MSKGLEAFKTLLNNYSYHEYDEGRVNTIDKELKALKIIKSKRVDVAYFLWCIDFYDYEEGLDLEEYNLSCIKDEWKLTKEEYDLLKEVLE